VKTIINDIKAFAKVMDKTKYKTPPNFTSAMFAMGEMGEIVQAWAYEQGEFLASREQEMLQYEMMDYLYMAVLAYNNAGMFDFDTAIKNRYWGFSVSVDDGDGIHEPTMSIFVWFDGYSDDVERKSLSFTCYDLQKYMRKRLIYRFCKVMNKCNALKREVERAMGALPFVEGIGDSCPTEEIGRVTMVHRDDDVVFYICRCGRFFVDL